MYYIFSSKDGEKDTQKMKNEIIVDDLNLKEEVSTDTLREPNQEIYDEIELLKSQIQNLEKSLVNLNHHLDEKFNIISQKIESLNILNKNDEKGLFNKLFGNRKKD